jgi:hypothetical protein
LLPNSPRSHSAKAQPGSAPSRDKQVHIKHILVIGQTKGWEHDSVSDGMAAIYNMGRESGLWEAILRTDTELITKKDLGGRTTKNLDFFDAIVFVSTTGELDLDDNQKNDMISFIKDDGKGFVGVHAALDTNYKVAGIRRNDRRLVRPTSLDDLQCADHQRSTGLPCRQHFPHVFAFQNEQTIVYWIYQLTKLIHSHIVSTEADIRGRQSWMMSRNNQNDSFSHVCRRVICRAIYAI